MVCLGTVRAYLDLISGKAKSKSRACTLIKQHPKTELVPQAITPQMCLGNLPRGGEENVCDHSTISATFLEAIVNAVGAISKSSSNGKGSLSDACGP